MSRYRRHQLTLSRDAASELRRCVGLEDPAHEARAESQGARAAAPPEGALRGMFSIRNCPGFYRSLYGCLLRRSAGPFSKMQARRLARARPEPVKLGETLRVWI